MRPQIHTQHQHTLFCKFTSAPAFTSSTTASVPHCPEAKIRAVSPPCMCTVSNNPYSIDIVRLYTVQTTYFILQVNVSSFLHQFHNIISITLLSCYHQCRVSILHEDNVLWGHRFIHNTSIHYSAGSQQLLLLLALLQPQSHIVLKLWSEQCLHSVR